MLRLRKLKPPYSNPSYHEIAEGSGLSPATVHTILRKGEFPRSSFASLEKILQFLNEPIAEYEALWNQVHEQLVTTSTVENSVRHNDFKIKSEALRNATQLYQGSAFPYQQILDVADKFEEWLRGEYTSD